MGPLLKLKPKNLFVQQGFKNRLDPLHAGTELISFNIVNIMVAKACPGSFRQDISTHDIAYVEIQNK